LLTCDDGYGAGSQLAYARGISSPSGLLPFQHLAQQSQVTGFQRPPFASESFDRLKRVGLRIETLDARPVLKIIDKQG
jgi:hypothetical protein